MKRTKTAKKAESEKIQCEAQGETLPAVNETEKKVRLRVFQHIAHSKKRRLLIAYVESGTLPGAARLAGMDWRMHYNWLDADKEYAESFERAKQMAADHGEDCVYERAFNGYDRQLTYKGKVTGHVIKEHSDLLSIFWLKGARPEKYREDSRLQVNVNVPPAINVVLPSPLIDVTEEKEEPLLTELSAPKE